MTIDQPRIYRWEAPTSRFGWHTLMILRHDDAAPNEDAYVAQYWTSRPADGWDWCTRGGRQSGQEPTEAAARHACLLAVLHVGEAGR